MNHETEVGALLLMASGFFFYLVMESGVVGAVLVTVGAWAMLLPRFFQFGDSTAR